MDYSAVTDAQQQLQYHEQLVYQNHYHLQQLLQSSCDPQAQTHEASYYAYHYDYDHSSAAAASAYDLHNHYYPHHYPHDYYSSSSAAYLPPPPPPPAHPAPAPAASAAAVPPHDTSQHHHPAVHVYPAPHEQPPLPSGFHVSPGLNPAAAAAALSQLTQLAGTMEAAERAMTGKQERLWHHHKAGSQLSMAHHRRHRRARHYPLSHQHGEVSVRPGVGVGGRSSHRGGSRRGHKPFGSGGVRSNSSYHPFKYDIGTPSFRGRGRGRIGNGGSRQYRQPVPDRQLLDSAPTSVMESSSVPDPGIAPEQTPLKATALDTESAQMLSRHPLLLLAWCDICRVDCNSFEILEQHKNGKRHKKTVQRIQEIEAQQKLMAELKAKVASKPEIVIRKAEGNKYPLLVDVKNALHQVSEAKIAPAGSDNVASAILSDQIHEASKMVDAKLKAEVFSAQDSKVNKGSNTPEAVIPAQVNEANKVSSASENLPAKTRVTEDNMESEVQSQILAGKSESSKEEAGGEAPMLDALEIVVPSMEERTRRPKMDGYDRYDKRHGQKQKMMKLGHDAKRSRRSEPVRSRPPVRPKEQPRVCTLCSVMCDTLAVFECHLSGKKHISRIKRFQGPHTVYGPISIYIPPNQPLAYPPQAPEPLFYGLKSHELLQHEAYGLNSLQIEGYGLQQGDQAKQGKEAENAALESQTELGRGHPENKVPMSGGEEATNVDAEATEDNSAFANSEDVVAVSEYGAPLDKSCCAQI